MSNASSRKALLMFGLSFAVTSLTACGHPVERRLQGRWVGESVENFDGPALAAVTGWARGTSFEFADDAMKVAIVGEEARTGKYEVVSFHDSKTVIQVKRNDGQKDKVELKLDEEHSMRWLLSDGRSIVMRRVD